MKLPKKIIPESETDYNAINALQALSYCDIKNKKVLVIGCNRGKDCSYFVIAGAKEVHGVDVMDETGADFKHKKVTYHKKSAENMDSLLDNYFDLVYCFATMEHIPDISAAFHEMARVCKVGGIVYSVAAPLWHSAYGNHRENFFRDYPWIHLLLPENKIKEWFIKNMAKKMPKIAKEIDRHIKYLFKSGTELFNKKKSAEYMDICNNLELRILVNEVERDPSHVLTNEAKRKLLPIYGEAELMGMTHRFVGKKIIQFSIIIPTHNTSGILPKALDSILAQTYKNYEIIIVDGDSTDGTLGIVKKYEKKFDGRLRWVSEPDSGIYDAMNKGIGMARGEWIYFLGSDDIFYSKKVLEEVSQKIETSDTDIIYGNVQWGDTDKIYDGKFSALKLMEKNICHQAIFFKRSLFDKIGKFDLKYKLWADWVSNMRWFNDESIKREYFEIIVAKYGTEGFSSISVQDEKFMQDRDKLIEKYFPKEYGELYKKTCQKDVELLQKDKELLQKNGELQEKNGELQEKNKKLLQKKRELDFVKSSKFWKMRNRYIRLKSLFPK